MTALSHSYAETIEIIQSSQQRQLLISYDETIEGARGKFLESCQDIAQQLEEQKDPNIEFKVRPFIGSASVGCKTNQTLKDFMQNDLYVPHLQTFRYELPRTVYAI